MNGSDLYIVGLSQFAADIEIQSRGLHHEHISTLAQVYSSLLQRLASICGVHLMRSSVAEARHRVRCITKRTVESTRVLNCVGHYGNVLKSGIIQTVANSANSSVHHIRWRNDVGACCGVGDRCFHKQSDT